MKYKSKIKSFVIIFLFILIAANLYTKDIKADTTEKYISGELLVKFINDSEIYKFTFDPKSDLEEILDKYYQNKQIEFVEYNHLFSISAFPNDTEYGKQDYLSMISARDAWSRGTFCQIRMQRIIHS